METVILEWNTITYIIYYISKKFQLSIKTFQSILADLNNRNTFKNQFAKLEIKEIKYYISISSLFDSFWKTFNAKRFKQSLKFLKKAEVLDGNYDLDKVYDNYATVYYKLRDFQKAENYWIKAIDLNPDFFGYYQNLANLFFDQKRFKEAIVFYKKAIGYGKENNKISTMLGLSYLFINKIDLSKEQLKIVLKDDPGNKIAINALQKIKEFYP